MVASHRNLKGKTGKNRVVAELGSLGGHAMEYFRKILQTSAKSFADGLMPQTNAEDGFLSGICAYNIEQ